MSDCKHDFQQQLLWHTHIEYPWSEASRENPPGRFDYAWVCAICGEPGYEVPDEHPR